MPYQCSDNEPRYVENMGILKAIIDEIDNTCYAIVGDWNANLKYIDNSLFANHMFNFCSENNLKISSFVHFPGNLYTYISERWSTNSWLDHVVASNDFQSKIDILYDIIYIYNHLPVLQISMFMSCSQDLVAASWRRRPAKPSGALCIMHSTTTCCTDCVMCPQAHMADS